MVRSPGQGQPSRTATAGPSRPPVGPNPVDMTVQIHTHVTTGIWPVGSHEPGRLAGNGSRVQPAVDGPASLVLAVAASCERPSCWRTQPQL